MRIEKFETRQLISGPARTAVRLAVLSLMLPFEWLEHLFGHHRRYVLILSHMRAGSSLLTNVVASSDEVSGYGETFTRYASRLAFRHLLGRVRLQRLLNGRLTVPGTIVVDKALHNKLTPDPEVLDHPGASFIFLIRDGERSVQSMMHEFEVGERVAADYYVERLEHLLALARFLRARGRPMMFLTFEELTSPRGAALDRLGRFLRLERALSTRFKAAPGASRPGAGDPSGRLGAGEILPTQRELTCDLADETKVRLAAAHQRAATELGAAAARAS